MSIICRFSLILLKEFPYPCEQGQWWAKYVNVVKERSLGCSYSSSSSASLSCSTVLLSVPRAKRENFFLHNVAMGIKYLKNMLNGVYYYRRKRRTRAISERAPRGRSQTTFTRRGRQVFHKCPLFVNIYTIENVSARGRWSKKPRNLVNVVCERPPIMRRYYCIELHDCCLYSMVLLIMGFQA